MDKRGYRGTCSALSIMCVLMILLFFLVLFVCSFFCLNGGRKDKSAGGGFTMHAGGCGTSSFIRHEQRRDGKKISVVLLFIIESWTRNLLFFLVVDRWSLF